MMVEAAAEVADYAARYGITTMVENHGFFVNGSDRIIRLAEAVNRPNFKMCLDTGNLLCVDEPPETSIRKCMPYVGMIHLKDFVSIVRNIRASGDDGFVSLEFEGIEDSRRGTYTGLQTAKNLFADI